MTARIPHAPLRVATGLALALGLLACRPPGSGAPAPERLAVAALDLRDASVTELVGQLSTALATPVSVATDAVPLTRCARVTLVVPAGTPRLQVLALAREVLAGAALSLEDANDHLVISRVEDADPPADCPRIPRARPTDPLLGGDAVERVMDPLPPSAPVEGIRLVSENTYEVDPEAEVFRDWPTAMMTQARIIPYEEDGQVMGLRLYGIRRSSTLGNLGFQNGDRVTQIDGQAVRGPDSALEIYARTHARDRITVDLIRRGAPLTLTFVRAAAPPAPSTH